MKALRNIKAPNQKISIRWVPVNGWRIRQGDIKGCHHGTLDAALEDWNTKAKRDAGQALHGIGYVTDPEAMHNCPKIEGVPVPDLAGWPEAEKAFKAAILESCPGVAFTAWPWEEAKAHGLAVLDGDIKRDRQLAEMLGWVIEPGDTLEIGKPGIVGSSSGARKLKQAPKFNVTKGTPEIPVVDGDIFTLDEVKAKAMALQEIGRGYRTETAVKRTERGASFAGKEVEARAQGIVSILANAYGIMSAKARKCPGRNSARIVEYAVIEDPFHAHHWPADRLQALIRAVEAGSPRLVAEMCAHHGEEVERAEARAKHQEPQDGHGTEGRPGDLFMNPPLGGVKCCDDKLCPYHLLDRAWGIIANANGGEWRSLSKDWQDAAASWRDDFHNFIMADVPGQASADPIAAGFRETREGIENREREAGLEKVRDLLKGSMPTGPDKPPAMPRGLAALLLLSAMAGAMKGKQGD